MNLPKHIQLLIESINWEGHKLLYGKDGYIIGNIERPSYEIPVNL